MPKFSQIATNASPAIGDYMIGVTSGNVDMKITLAQLAALISTNLTDNTIAASKLMPRVAVGTISTAANGSVTGLSFKPKTVTFLRLNSTSVTVFTYGISVDDGGSGVHYAVGTTSSTAGTDAETGNSIVNPTGNGTNNVLGKVSSFDAAGFSFTLSKTASTTMLYIAQG